MSKKSENSTLCWSCEKACGDCRWSLEAKPIPNWEAEPTFIRNESAPSYASYLVKSCPEYVATVDFFDTKAEFKDLIARRTGKSAYLIQTYAEVNEAAFFRYLLKCPRSMNIPEEERNACLTQLWEEEYEKNKLEKMSKKSKKILKKC